MSYPTDNIQNEVFLLLGGNLGDRMKNISSATDKITDRIGKTLRISSVYESEAWGFETEQSFFNRIVVVETILTPIQILQQIENIEMEMGRVRTGLGYASRIIDIDILFYNDEIINLPELQVPHPRLHQRRFTLMPLAEVAPGKIHPLLQKSISQLLNECNDALRVEIINNDI